MPKAPRSLALACLAGCTIAGTGWADPGTAHPVVAGFERFGTEHGSGGRLLLGELNCTSCHATSGAAAEQIDRKQAPILDRVGGRARAAWLRRYLADPHATKPGTTMPDLLGGLAEAERAEAVEALVQFLASTAPPPAESRPSRRAINEGDRLYHHVGCVACHGPIDKGTEPLPTSVPLGDLAGKYTIPSLAAFLRDPHAVRPSGRMPSLNLTGEEADLVAQFLLREIYDRLTPNLAFSYYEGNWEELPDLDAMEPRRKGESLGFDLGVARRQDNIALKFAGFIKIERAGEYTFHLRSDDGSRLWIDGEEVVDNDGVHPAQTVTGKIRLEPGMHRLVAGFFNAFGEIEFDVEVQGPGLPRQSAASIASLTETPEPVEAVADRLVPDPDLADRGRELFATIGCASCHQLRQDGKAIASKLEADPLAALIHPILPVVSRRSRAPRPPTTACPAPSATLCPLPFGTCRSPPPGSPRTASSLPGR